MPESPHAHDVPDSGYAARPPDRRSGTVTIVIVFGLLGAFWACDFVAVLLQEQEQLFAPGFTSLGYVIVLIPGVAAATCFGTVLLRLLSKPSAWLGCIGMLFSAMVVFFGMIAMFIALTIPRVPVGVGIAIVAFALSIGVGVLGHRAT